MNQGEEQAPRRRVQRRARHALNDSRAEEEESIDHNEDEDRRQAAKARRQPKVQVQPEQADEPDEDDLDSYSIEYDDEDVKEVAEQNNESPMLDFDGPVERLDEDDFGSESGLSELSNEQSYFAARLTYQRKALFTKLVTLQMRAKGTNLVQICVPLFGLALCWYLQFATGAIAREVGDKSFFVPYPYIFGLGYKALQNIIGEPLMIRNCDKWFFTVFDEEATEETKQYWGSNTGAPWHNPQSHGLIDGRKNMLSTPCNTVKKQTPYFKDWATYNKEELGNRYETIDKFLYEHVERLERTPIDYFDRFMDNNEDVKALPDVVYRVKEANDKKLRFDAAVNDEHCWQYHRENGFTKVSISDRKMNYTTSILRTIEGQVEAASLINKAYIKNIFPNTTVMTGINFYPLHLDFTGLSESLVGKGLEMALPMCLALNMPVFMYSIVLEKEKKLTEIMKINGLQIGNYWIVNYFFNWLYYVVTAGTWWIAGAYVMRLKIFLNTSPFLFLTVLNGWGLSQISYAFFLSVFIHKASTASIVGYGAGIYAMIMASILQAIVYNPPFTLPFYYHLIPQFTFTRAILYFATECREASCYQSVSEFQSVEGRIVVAVLYLQALVYAALAWYCYQVVPQSYGVPKRWNFLCKGKSKPGVRGISYDYDEIGDLEEERETNNAPVYDYDTSLEDSDSKAERNIVYNLDKADYYKYPLVIKDLRKVYKGVGGRSEKVATKNFSLRIKKGEMFGLLGPNGAGKTTLIAMLTGMYPATRGNAWVAGFDIKYQLEAVQLQIGFCPQFDVLWDDLTVKEHLLFYARIKGIPPHQEEDYVTRAIADVLLERFTNFKPTQLSGGMKRRLSVAISLVSDPKIIYLDEPSTGLDPENRRQLWDILSKLRGKRAMVLTTHSMEEADVLCSRIAIVNNGILRCIAPQVRLKSLYGGGYHLDINCMKESTLKREAAYKKRQARKAAERKQAEMERERSMDIRAHPQDSDSPDKEEEELKDEEEENMTIEQIHNKVKSFVRRLLPRAELITDFNGNFMYLIPTHGFNASRVYQEFEQNKRKLKIADWGLSQSTLEDVFTKICEQNGDNNA